MIDYAVGSEGNARPSVPDRLDLIETELAFAIIENGKVAVFIMAKASSVSIRSNRSDTDGLAFPSRADSIVDQGVREFCGKESRGASRRDLVFIRGLWVSYPLSIFQAQNKLYQLQVAKKLGFRIPRTLVTNDPVRAKEFVKSSSCRIVAKAVRQGISDG